MLSSEVVLPRLDVYVRAGRGFAAVQLADSKSAESEYAALRAQEGVAPVFLGLSADRLLGLVSETAGDPEAATVHFQSGLAYCRGAGYLPEYAWTAADLAGTLSSRSGPGDRASAERLRDEARGLASQFGMQALSSRLARRS